MNNENDSTTERRRLHAVVRGRVQGVFFRYFVHTEATKLGLVGSVWNMPDGSSVEVMAEGLAADLEALLVKLRSGPPRAYVEAVDVEWQPPLADTTEFKVL